MEIHWTFWLWIGVLSLTKSVDHQVIGWYYKFNYSNTKIWNCGERRSLHEMNMIKINITSKYSAQVEDLKCRYVIVFNRFISEAVSFRHSFFIYIIGNSSIL